MQARKLWRLLRLLCCAPLGRSPRGPTTWLVVKTRPTNVGPTLSCRCALVPSFRFSVLAAEGKSGRARAARNLAEHSLMGEGAEVISHALTQPQHAQRAGRRSRRGKRHRHGESSAASSTTDGADVPDDGEPFDDDKIVEIPINGDDFYSISVVCAATQSTISFPPCCDVQADGAGCQVSSRRLKGNLNQRARNLMALRTLRNPLAPRHTKQSWRSKRILLRIP